MDSALFFIKDELFFYSWNLQVRYENYKSDKKRSKDKKSLWLYFTIIFNKLSCPLLVNVSTRKSKILDGKLPQQIYW